MNIISILFCNYFIYNDKYYHEIQLVYFIFIELFEAIYNYVYKYDIIDH